MDISRIIKRYQYVSFDVFDTLIKRSFAQPQDLFLLIQQYCTDEKLNISCQFAEKRKAAELRANEKTGRTAQLHEIYDELRLDLGDNADRLMALEIQMELDSCIPNPQCVSWLNQCVAAGKTVVLISDMYLPAQIIAKMLEKCGIREYKTLFVSCEFGTRKRDGSLFRTVLQELHIRSNQLVHIGDNWRSDFITPLSMGIKAIKVENDQQRLAETPGNIDSRDRLAYRTLKACIRNCSYGMTEYERQGCEILGPMLYGFMQWLARQMRQDGVSDVYFMSRDGYIMQHAFDELKINNINAHYLYCSRRAYQVPLLWRHSKFEEVIQPFLHADRMTLRSFLLRIGLEPDKYAEVVKSFGLNLDHVYEKGAFYHSKEIMDFYGAIRADAEKNSKEEYDSLRSYLCALQMPKKIAVVDIGYHGTMQKALMELIREEHWDIEVMGYYVGISPDAGLVRTGEIRAKGYLYDLDSGASHWEQTQKGIALFELQFLAPHGSVKRFTLQNGISEPVFDEFEYVDSENQKIHEMAIIREYQAGALSFVKYMASVIPNGIRVDPEIAVFAFEQLLTQPTFEQARLWGDFRIVNYTYSYLAAPQRLPYYLLHPKQFRKEFLECYWKIGFMRRLFRVPLPYNRIYTMLKGFYRK